MGPARMKLSPRHTSSPRCHPAWYIVGAQIIVLLVLFMRQDRGCQLLEAGALPAEPARQLSRSFSRAATAVDLEEPAEQVLTPALLRAVQQDPSLLLKPAVASAFLPMPWLLPESDQARQLLPYRGLHNDLGALLAVRVQPVGEQGTRAVATVSFSHHHSILVQNWIYTAVRWAGITNYIVLTFEDESLAACQKLNLPCFNASSYLPLPLGTEGESTFMRGNFAAITWMKPMLAKDILSRGYIIQMADADIAFPAKAFWPSVLHFMEPGSADVAMERDFWGPVNCGLVTIRPNNATLAWISKWTEEAAEHAKANRCDQEGLMPLAGTAFRTCDAPWDCQKLRKELDEQSKAKGAPAPALIRRYASGFDAIHQDHCTGAHPDWASPVDPCAPTAMYYHIVCTSGLGNKIAGLKATGLWFMDEEATSGCMDPPLSGLENEELNEEPAWWREGWAGGTVKGAAQQAQRVLGADMGHGRLLLSQGEGITLGSTTVQGTNGQGTSSTSGQGRGLAAKGVGVPKGGKTHSKGEGELPRGAETAQSKKQAQAARRCRPAYWRVQGAEDAFRRCDKSQLAYVYYPAIA